MLHHDTANDGGATIMKSMAMRLGMNIVAVGILALAGCSKPQYDASTPRAALDSMHQMIVDGHPEMLGSMIHIQPRDISYDDGVTEASAIQNVIDKAGAMLGQLYRVAGKIRQRFPDAVKGELATAQKASERGGLQDIGRFLADPFGLMDEQRQRLTVEDLGDGTAAIQIDGKPAFGFGLLMRENGGKWQIDIPIGLLQKYRPNTREEWAVIANMMLSLERAFTAFESELDQGQFADLNQASNRAGRLLGERAFVQAIIYQSMKEKKGEGA